MCSWSGPAGWRSRRNSRSRAALPTPLRGGQGRGPRPGQVVGDGGEILVVNAAAMSIKIAWKGLVPSGGMEIRALSLQRVRARMSVPGRKVAGQWPGGGAPGRDPHRTPGPVQVGRAYKFRAYPTRPQDGSPGWGLGDYCDL